jgi:hypothetical protein
MWLPQKGCCFLTPYPPCPLLLNGWCSGLLLCRAGGELSGGCVSVCGVSRRQVSRRPPARLSESKRMVTRLGLCAPGGGMGWCKQRVTLKGASALLGCGYPGQVLAGCLLV